MHKLPLVEPVFVISRVYVTFDNYEVHEQYRVKSGQWIQRAFSEEGRASHNIFRNLQFPSILLPIPTTTHLCHSTSHDVHFADHLVSKLRFNEQKHEEKKLELWLPGRFLVIQASTATVVIMDKCTMKCWSYSVVLVVYRYQLLGESRKLCEY